MKARASGDSAPRHHLTKRKSGHLKQHWSLSPGVDAPVAVSSSPVRAVRGSGRDAINVDIGLYAQDRLVLAFGRHLGSTGIDVLVVVTRLFTLVS